MEISCNLIYDKLGSATKNIISNTAGRFPHQKDQIYFAAAERFATHGSLGFAHTPLLKNTSALLYNIW